MSIEESAKNRLARLATREKSLRQLLSQHRLSEVLLAVRVYGEHLRPFHKAGISIWAIKACRSDVGTPDTNPISRDRFDHLERRVMNYLLDSPADLEEEPDLISMILPLVGSQFVYEVGHGDFTRGYILWHVLPPSLIGRKGVNFDFESSFSATHGVKALDFIRFAFTTFSGVFAHARFTRSYYQKAVKGGIIIPDGDSLSLALKFIAAGKEELASMAEDLKEKDRLYSVYDYNPLLMRPLVRPWSNLANQAEEGLIAPLPDLLPYRASFGVYYELVNNFGRAFTQYFGYLLEAYVGIILSNFKDFAIVSEDSMSSYTLEGEKNVDWCLTRGEVVIAFEVKATRFNRTALVAGDSLSVEKSLAKIKHGMRQLNQFGELHVGSCSRSPQLKGCDRIIKVVVTWETMPLVGSKIMVEQFYPEHGEDGTIILSVQQLEDLQMFSAGGEDLIDMLDLIRGMGFNEAIALIADRTKVSHADSFMSHYDEQLYKEMGV